MVSKICNPIGAVECRR